MRYFLSVLLFIFSFSSEVLAQSEWENFRISFNKALTEGSSGRSEAIEMPFGTISLVSCRTGIKNLSGLAVGVDVQLKSGWILTDIDLKPSSEYSQATVLPLFQENKIITENWTGDYQKSTIFPIWLSNMDNHDVPLTVLGQFHACSTDTYKCIDVKQPLNLLLRADEAYPALACGAIQFALKNAAIDIQNTSVQAENQLLPDGRLKVRIVFPKNSPVVDIQSLKTPLDQVFKKNDGRVFISIFRPKNELRVGDIIPLNIRSSVGCFTWNLTVADQTLKPIPVSLPWGFGFWSGILFFFLSPLWCAWLMPYKIAQNPNLFRKKVRQLQGMAILTIGIWGIGWLTGLNIEKIYQSTFAVILAIGMMIYLIIRPIPKKIWIMGILIILMPRPWGYFYADIAIKTKIYLMLWWMVCACIPFNIWLLAPKPVLKFFNGVQEQNIPTYRIIARLPYWILLCWLGIGLTGHIYFKKDPIFIPEKAPKPAIIRVNNPLCLKCVSDRALLLFPFRSHLYRIDAHSKWVAEKRKLYHINNDTFYIYIKSNGQEILLPEKLTRKTLAQSLSN